MTSYRFNQIDVFTDRDLFGNPVAVVHNADGLDDETMARFARWTNLSETTFLCSPLNKEADYLLRIFTPGGELPFAGHPTLGSCRAWLHAGGIPKSKDKIIQQCGIGNVTIKQDGELLGFAAPELLRSGPLENDVLATICRALRINEDAVVAHQWTCNGPEWASIMLQDAQHVRDLRPDFSAMGDLKVGVIGKATLGDSDFDFEVRAFVPGIGVPEDPVTGSLNAGIAHWLIGKGLAPDHYVVAQGSAMQRSGRVTVDKDGETIWILGDTRVCITGQLDI